VDREPGAYPVDREPGAHPVDRELVVPEEQPVGASPSPSRYVGTRPPTSP
jgi:hypothetical protein